ncbi:MAG: hypothetical protein KF866_11115 [Phycisphaeraceae bacterium]|nr:hypothetical protein [Phycisphaeraceae bacterium]MCW5754274.1 hypothetical protein [Phycisphaeraceae bacterium]
MTIPTSPQRPGTRDAASPALWASAFVLIALILTQAGRLVGNTARAEMVSQTGPYTVMTADGGNNDILIVLDARSERMHVYAATQRSVDMLQSFDVPQLFSDARQRTRGK